MSFEAIKMGRIPNIKKCNQVFDAYYNKEQLSSFNKTNIKSYFIVDKPIISKNVSSYNEHCQPKIKDILLKNNASSIIQTNSNKIDSKCHCCSNCPCGSLIPINETELNQNRYKFQNEFAEDTKVKMMNNLNKYINITLKVYLKYNEKHLIFYGTNVKKSEINIEILWKRIMIGMKENIESFMNYAKEIPGINEIQNSVDFKILIKNHIFDYIIVNIMLMKKFLILVIIVLIHR